MSHDVDGATVVVSGAAGGIGAAVARRFAAAGATLVLGDLNAVALEELAGELAALTTVHALTCDVSVPADCQNLMDTAAADAGRVDVVVNTAGVWTEGPSEQTTEEEWDKVLDVNLKGTFFCCRYAIPHLKKTEGCIINLSSDAGVVGTPETAVYTASKGGVSLLTKSLALELAPFLVRCVAVCPADVLDADARRPGARLRRRRPGGLLQAPAGQLPATRQGRFITPEQVAELIHYLASPAAVPITGALISIDYGTSAGYGYG